MSGVGRGMTAQTVSHDQLWAAEQRERLITLIFDPSLVARVLGAANVVGRLYGRAERIAGYDDSTAGFHPSWVSTGPLRARALYWLGDRADELGCWANERRTARRMRRAA